MLILFHDEQPWAAHQSHASEYNIFQEKVNIEWEEIILHSWTTTVLDHLISNKKREKAQIHKSQV